MTNPVEMTSERARELVQLLDGSGSDAEWKAVEQLRVLGQRLPSLLLERFRSARRWQARSSCVYHSFRYATESEDALKLGLEAIRDRANLVRYRGAMLLAYSQRMDALPEMERALREIDRGKSADDIAAAIDAIRNRNHNWFVDRNHSGKVTMTLT